MRKLKIDLADLEIAFDSGSDLMSFYLDIETGKIVSVGDEDRFALEQIYASYYDEEAKIVDWEAAFLGEQIPDWQHKELQEADQIEADFGGRFIEIPSESSREGYQDMVAFIRTVRNLLLQERLDRAISGRGAFRYFKDVLLDYPAERERWFQFKQERLNQRILDWLESEDISLLEDKTE